MKNFFNYFIVIFALFIFLAIKLVKSYWSLFVIVIGGFILYIIIKNIFQAVQSRKISQSRKKENEKNIEKLKKYLSDRKAGLIDYDMNCEDRLEIYKNHLKEDLEGYVIHNDKTLKKLLENKKISDMERRSIEYKIMRQKLMKNITIDLEFDLGVHVISKIDIIKTYPGELIYNKKFDRKERKSKFDINVFFVPSFDSADRKKLHFIDAEVDIKIAIENFFEEYIKKYFKEPQQVLIVDIYPQFLEKTMDEELNSMFIKVDVEELEHL